MNFTNKIVLITGAGSGIGAETARHFARLNASLVLVDRNNEGLTQVGLDCEKLTGVKPLLIQADLTVDDDVSRIVKQAMDNFGHLDVLANIAGVYRPSPFEESTMEQFDYTHSVNIRALYHLTLMCIPHLIASKGVIVNISSCVSHRAFPGAITYKLTKGAVDHLTKSLAVELGPKGVRVNAVNPGLVDTPILDAYGSRRNEARDEFVKRIPLGRIGKTSDIAKAVAFLASDDASYITGVTLLVDGASSLAY